VHDQADIVVDAHRPEIRVARAIESMEAQAASRRIQLQIECRRLDCLLTAPVNRARPAVNVSAIRKSILRPPLGQVIRLVRDPQGASEKRSAWQRQR
jgi:hypothetical protein